MGPSDPILTYFITFSILGVLLYYCMALCCLHNHGQASATHDIALDQCLGTMIGKNRQLVADEPV